MQLFYPSCGSKKTVPGSSAPLGSEVIESLVPGQIFFTGFSVSFDKYFVFEKRLVSCKAVGLWHVRPRWEADDPAVDRLWRCSGPPPCAVGVVGLWRARCDCSAEQAGRRRLAGGQPTASGGRRGGRNGCCRSDREAGLGRPGTACLVRVSSWLQALPS